MESIKKNKILLVTFVITFIAFVYFVFFNGGDTVQNVISVDGTSYTGQTAAGQEILSLLAQLRTLKIDSNLFSDDVWTSLRVFSVILPDTKPGKKNLFDPIGQ